MHTLLWKEDEKNRGTGTKRVHTTGIGFVGVRRRLSEELDDESESGVAVPAEYNHAHFVLHFMDQRQQQRDQPSPSRDLPGENKSLYLMVSQLETDSASELLSAVHPVSRTPVMGREQGRVSAHTHQCTNEIRGNTRE